MGGQDEEGEERVKLFIEVDFDEVTGKYVANARMVKAVALTQDGSIASQGFDGDEKLTEELAVIDAVRCFFAFKRRKQGA